MPLTDEALEVIKSEAGDAAELLRVMGTPTRILLLCHLAKGECSVAELEKELGVRQPGLSQQLSELREKNLVKTRRESRSIFYSLSDAKVLRILEGLHGALFGATLEPFELPKREQLSSQGQGDAARFARVIR